MIKIENLNISFKSEIIYNDFSLSVSKGEKVAIIGKSGKGKSTLLNLLAGFISDFKGNVQINGIQLNTENISEIRKQIAWLPQETALNFKTVKELFFAPFNFEINKKLKPSEKEISDIFRELELSTKLLNKKTKEISGGQKQRILLASCLLLNRPLLLIDEPTSALDDSIKMKVTDFILSKRNLTVISATHDEYWIKKSDTVIELK
ncbi:MAG: ATP-binding cassette domain-containing protein [Chlorobi bacterium]|nr:ATP-binding cassette domain-containing protein [Chlorobiota bacterium]